MWWLRVWIWLSEKCFPFTKCKFQNDPLALLRSRTIWLHQLAADDATGVWKYSNQLRAQIIDNLLTHHESFGLPFWSGFKREEHVSEPIARPMPQPSVWSVAALADAGETCACLLDLFENCYWKSCPQNEWELCNTPWNFLGVSSGNLLRPNHMHSWVCFSGGECW